MADSAHRVRPIAWPLAPLRSLRKQLWRACGATPGRPGSHAVALSRCSLGLALLLSMFLAACAAATPASTLGAKPTEVPRTPTPVPASDEDAIRGLMAAEGQRVVAQDITGLMELWADDATITDAKHTPDEPADDANWRGRDAIRERYVVLVFPGNPSAAGAADVEIEIVGDRATATSTTVIGGEVSPGGDRWTFVKRDGRWWIASLTYNLEPAQ